MPPIPEEAREKLNAPGNMDGVCRKCRLRYGWAGKPSDKPSCPRCGYREDAASLAEDDRIVAEAREEIRRMTAARVSIGEKVRYVKRQGQTRDHHCHWPGCEAQVPPAMWGCRKHWYRLPQRLRNLIWSTFRPGQETNWTPSRAYLDAAREVQEWIEENAVED
jgi:hypothetical protein